MTDRLLKLMSYADGELDAADRAEVERWLATDANAVRFVDDLAVLGDFVTLGHAHAAPKVDLADAIMAKVADAKVVPLHSRSRTRLPARSRSLALGGIVAALAVAASVFFFTRAKDEEPLGGGALATAVAPAPTGTGVDVDLHETPGQSVGVFYNETSVKTTSVTVWVDETGAK